MEIKRHLEPAARVATAAAGVSLSCAGIWDALRLARVPVWPGVSYALAAAAAVAAFTGVVLRIVTRRRARGRHALELAATALVLLAWWLRGDPGIPADTPVVGAELCAALVFGGSAWLDRRRVRRDRRRVPPRRPPRASQPLRDPRSRDRDGDE